ncbi:tax1-binding protein 1 homolog B isoform X1 [Erpetoichthys calabaricus]|uniref:tax1-binding protein 1 homolog B isoform X1 n=1 Tax=Erpetoichthys calabaricus TaxID=27687 RepID=UPI002233F179|nr:tax1-binding protein 1 homolog B isoform X1 [Erpetoichthys calabaricus]
MAQLHEGSSAGNTMETSNFAHVIFQNVAKSYLPHAALECHYTLTQHIKPHQKDWVGIFKVGWSTARDYYTFLWSPVPENYTEGTSVNRVVVFQGYYVPNDDGEFYQFCYVTHKGEIRGASTPFQFRASSPTDDLLTVEDDNNSDILVVTTKAGFLEQKIVEVIKEKDELQKEITSLGTEKDQLLQQTQKLKKEISEEKETCVQIRREYEELVQNTQSLKKENEEIRQKYQESFSKVLQLEEDLIEVTQKGIGRETELDSLRDCLKKLSAEKEHLASQIKNEKDEKELYMIHLKNTELENTKLAAEVQILKSASVNKDNQIAQLKEEVYGIKQCMAENEKLQKEIMTTSANKDESVFLREQLRKTEEQLQATRQEVALLSAELRDVASVRDKTMSDLYSARLEVDALKKSLSEVETECKTKELLLQSMKDAMEKHKKEDNALNITTEQELHKEIDDLKLRLQMAAEHYKEKYKECQKLQKQVVKLKEQGEVKKTASSYVVQKESMCNEGSGMEIASPVSCPSSEASLETLFQDKMKVASKDANEKNDKYKKCKQLLTEEKERSRVYADELEKLELKWKEQCKIIDTLKLQVAAEEDRYKSQVAEKGREVNKLKENLTLVYKEMEKLEEELQRKMESQPDRIAEGQSSHISQQVILQYPVPYSEEYLIQPVEPARQPELQFGNPYCPENTRDETSGTFSPSSICRPPVGPPSWDNNVVCIQPARNLSRPDGLEDVEELVNLPEMEAKNGQGVASNSPHSLLQDPRAHFCFDSSIDVHKRCPLCEVIFPPNYDQSKFEEHVESHWKVCPMCNEQFPLNCQQQVFEKHVMTHFDGSVLNFE